MTKAELVAKVAKKVGLTKKGTEEVMDTLFEVLGTACALARVEFPDFGVFLPRVRAARDVVNPQTHQRQRLPEARTVGFRPAKALRAKAAAVKP